MTIANLNGAAFRAALNAVLDTPGRNKIIGGDFTLNPWQRGTSFTALASGSYAADRFFAAHSSDGIVDILKTADAPTAAQAGTYTAHCLHADVTTADATIAAGQYYTIRQNVEGLNAASFGFGQAGTRYVTLSFWHKHTKAGTYCVALKNSANNRSYVAEYTQAVTDTWEKATLTIPVDASGTWLYDTGIGIRVVFAVAVGSTYQTTASSWQAGDYVATANQVNALDSTANNFKIALVQLEAGSVASAFDFLSGGQALTLCQRYYEKSFNAGTAPVQNAGAGTGEFRFQAITAGATTQRSPTVRFAVRKRAAPSTITLFNPSAANDQVRDATASADCSGAGAVAYGEQGFVVNATGNAATAAGNGLSFHWAVEAEL